MQSELLSLPSCLHRSTAFVIVEYCGVDAEWAGLRRRRFQGPCEGQFFQGSSLKDPKHLFNAGLEAKASRAIDFSEGANLNATALKDLIRAAVAYDLSAKPKN
jgi:hypothetical protein